MGTLVPGRQYVQSGFELNKKIIGHGGSYTRGIFDATGAKIRLRGRGSKHIEGSREAPVPLMLAVTTDQGKEQSFRKAFVMATELLQKVERQFNSFCAKAQSESSDTEARFWVGELCAEGWTILGRALDGVEVMPSTSGNRKVTRRCR